ncbi:DUF4145 domain-containing protein [Rheinheimera texasensis]|uniref:DUF4145 domain-containing protein n=1 Tax=Rheinheimera texasensis TaxID=306205 RepID=UPI0032B126EE
MSKYYPPKLNEASFNCALCGVYAKQEWDTLAITSSVGPNKYTDFKSSRCCHCVQRSYWFLNRMIVPSEAPVPPHHVDTPASCVDLYNEARDIVSRSPRAAAALLRLCVQNLMIELGEKGKNINDDIASLVKGGLPVEVQQALDYCRVIGNNGVHPGEIELTDRPEMTHSLFEMINFIIEDRIARPKKIRELYNTLPEGALNAVKKRDGD